MATVTLTYLGELRCESTHQSSQTHLITDAPLDNQGKASSYSPTDLLATALGTCMMTVMGIKARDLQVDLTGTTLEMTKIMESNPRRVSEVQLIFNFPSLNLDEKTRKILENTALNCPVAKSIHPDLTYPVTFNW